MSDLIERIGKLQDDCNKNLLSFVDPEYVFELVGRAADEIERLTFVEKNHVQGIHGLEKRIAELEAQCEALQNKCATRGLSPEDSDALEAEIERLRAALRKIARHDNPDSIFEACAYDVRVAKAALKGGDDE